MAMAMHACHFAAQGQCAENWQCFWAQASLLLCLLGRPRCLQAVADLINACMQPDPQLRPTALGVYEALKAAAPE